MANMRPMSSTGLLKADEWMAGWIVITILFRIPTIHTSGANTTMNNIQKQFQFNFR